MKKLLTLFATLALAALSACTLFGCSGAKTPDDTIVIGASSTPHAEILESIREDVLSEGYKLDIVIYDDYVMPNTALEEGSLDANYFQHTPYLDNFNEARNTHLVAAAKIHYELFGVFGNNVSKAEFEATKTGRTIFVPSDGTNCARALFVLQQNGYITLKEGVKPNDALTDSDIANSNGNTVTLVEAAQLPAQLKNADAGSLAVINGNYALGSGYQTGDLLAVEAADEDNAQLYANVVAVKEGNETSKKTQALLKALQSQKVIDFINKTYGGAVLPVFEV